MYPKQQLHYKVYGKNALVNTNKPALTTHLRHTPHHTLDHR
jgi:hypothetical protein